MTESTRLYRFRGDAGEVLEITATGTIVTSRISALGFYGSSGKAIVELAADAWEVDAVIARIAEQHRSEGFVVLDDAALATQLATIEPYRRWQTLTPATFAEHFAYLLEGRPCAAFDRLAASVRTIDPQHFRVELTGGVELVCALPLAPDELAKEPGVLRRFWERHAVIWAERDGFEVILGSDLGPPEPDLELRDFGGTCVEWVMSRGTEQFWFLDGDGRFRMCDLDGGVGEPIDLGLGELWADRVAALL